MIPIEDSPFMVANFLCSRGVLSTRRAASTTLPRQSLLCPEVIPTMERKGVMKVELNRPLWYTPSYRSEDVAIGKIASR